MRALMFGWEFPPHILGGLGTASYGLTKGMSLQPDMDITFVIPKPWGDEDQSFLHIIGACNVPIVWKDVNWNQVNERLGGRMHPDEYFQLRNGIKYDFRRIGTNDIGCVDFSGRYPDNLLEEISNYEAVASVIAPNKSAANRWSYTFMPPTTTAAADKSIPMCIASRKRAWMPPTTSSPCRT